MKITEIRATNLEIPYGVEYRPAWQPGLRVEVNEAMIERSAV